MTAAALAPAPSLTPAERTALARAWTFASEAYGLTVPTTSVEDMEAAVFGQDAGRWKARLLAAAALCRFCDWTINAAAAACRVDRNDLTPGRLQDKRVDARDVEAVAHGVHTGRFSLDRAAPRPVSVASEGLAPTKAEIEQMQADAARGQRWAGPAKAWAVKLYRAGQSASVIAKKIRAWSGQPVTRNAIIGHANRGGATRTRETATATARLQGATKRMAARARPAKPKIVPTAPKMRVVEPDAFALPAAVQPVVFAGPSKALADLAPGECRWPLDDPGPGRMDLTRFCASQRGEGPYCPAHEATAAGKAGPRTPVTERELMRSVRRYV